MHDLLSEESGRSAESGRRERATDEDEGGGESAILMENESDDVGEGDDTNRSIIL